jgi:signal transduction histidine kinase
VATSGWSSRIFLEAVLAFVAGAVWFAVSGALLEVLPSLWVLILGVIALDVVVVLATARYWSITAAVTVGVASVVALDWYSIPPTHSSMVPDARNSVGLAAYLVTGVLLGELAVIARRRAQASEQARKLLADEQAALRRVATLVAREASPGDVFATVTEEVGRLFDLDMITMARYETDATATVVAAWSEASPHLPVGSRFPLEGVNVTTTVFRTRQPVRFPDFSFCSGSLVDHLRTMGVRSSAGCPILVDGRLWGVMVASSTSPEPTPPGTESRLGEFTELVATAIANAETRAELQASRARIVATGDEARRHLERDLHDGVQQRLVSLALELRVAEKLAPPEGNDELTEQLSHIGEGLIAAVDELREVSHGIHPAILSEGGLRPALSTVARRSPVPVELEIRDIDRLPEPVEVGVYYVVSEALTNVIKHAQASFVRVDLEGDDVAVRLLVQDDGVGGADPVHGSGLIGLKDRVHALGGRIEIASPAGAGTSLEVTVPVNFVSGTNGTHPLPTQ